MLGTVEIRQEENGPATLRGRFPYGATATVKNRGRVRKERMAPRAFRFAIDDTRQGDQPASRSLATTEPLASRSAGTLDIRDGDDAVTFRATLARRCGAAVLDAGRALVGPRWPDGWRIAGVHGAAPGRGAERSASRCRNPATNRVMIREIAEAVLLEMSLVTRPAYPEHRGRGAGVA